MATVFGLMLPHPGAKVPLIVAPSLVHEALYATCFRFCEDVQSQLTNGRIVEQTPHINFFEEPIPDYCNEAPAPVSAKRPRDITILLIEDVNSHS
jgi:hypothetical protein